MNEQYKPLFMWHMRLRVMRNPLRIRNRLTAVDIAAARSKLNAYLMTRRLLVADNTKH